MRWSECKKSLKCKQYIYDFHSTPSVTVIFMATICPDFFLTVHCCLGDDSTNSQCIVEEIFSQQDSDLLDTL